MTKRRYSVGSAHLVIMLFLFFVVLVGLGYAAWISYNNQQANSEEADIAIDQPQGPTENEPKAETPSPTVDKNGDIEQSVDYGGYKLSLIAPGAWSAVPQLAAETTNKKDTTDYITITSPSGGVSLRAELSQNSTQTESCRVGQKSIISVASQVSRRDSRYLNVQLTHYEYNDKDIYGYEIYVMPKSYPFPKVNKDLCSYINNASFRAGGTSSPFVSARISFKNVTTASDKQAIDALFDTSEYKKARDILSSFSLKKSDS